RDTNIQSKRPLQCPFSVDLAGSAGAPGGTPPFFRGNPSATFSVNVADFGANAGAKLLFPQFFLIWQVPRRNRGSPVERLPGIEETICSMRQLQRASLAHARAVRPQRPHLFNFSSTQPAPRWSSNVLSDSTGLIHSGLDTFTEHLTLELRHGS